MFVTLWDIFPGLGWELHEPLSVYVTVALSLARSTLDHFPRNGSVTLRLDGPPNQNQGFLFQKLDRDSP